MKNPIFRKAFITVAGITALTLFAMPVAAENSSPASATTSAGQTASQLSYGVPDVLKLSQAKVGEDTIVAFIKNSGSSYGGLNATEIVYLHEQGVSDRVVTTMLDQRKKSTEAAAQTITQQTTPATANAAQYPQPYVPPTVTYVQPAPVSTVYVMRDSSPRLVDYGIYPSYGYCGYSYPRLSFSFGFGGGYRGSYYGGGFRSGGFHSGGFRGGGWHHR